MLCINNLYVLHAASKSPEEIAAYLEQDEALEETHSSAAQGGQSEQVEDVDDVTNHFVCFSQVHGSLYELDGRKSCPVNHGPSSPDTLLQDACKVWWNGG
ncbi:hypothetical protein EON63_08695 [archaeon]|nr:MAG: hypothetical protein EON63_08695 [archaeon]